MGTPGTFAVARWLAAHPPSSCGVVHVSQPQLLIGWTKAAVATASGGASGGSTDGKYSYGDVTGKIQELVGPYLRLYFFKGDI